METFVSAIDVQDAEYIVQQIDFPSMREGPLYRLMFPAYPTEPQRSEIIQWYTRGLANALKCKTNKFLQICATDGSPLGFSGWAMEQRGVTETTRMHKSSQHDLLPESLDLRAWLGISRELRKERERVLDGINEVCRLTYMSIHPDHQRQGLGSTLLQEVCDEIDELGWQAFVMASPAGARLYAKFGFKVVGKVETCQGAFTSMLREARPRTKYIDV